MLVLYNELIEIWHLGVD